MESNMATEQMAEQYASKEMSFLTFAPLTSNEIYDIIKQAYVAGAKDKWVKVEDGLPGKEGIYLCFLKGGDIKTVHYSDKYEGTNKWNVKGGYTVVTHWMPLPQPPKD